MLRTNAREDVTPIIIRLTDGKESSVGRLIDRRRARLMAFVDTPVERERLVTIFLPGNTYLGEVVKCSTQEDGFAVEVDLIQSQLD